MRKTGLIVVVDVLKFLLVYISSIVATVTIYVHLKFNMVSFDIFLWNIREIKDIEWALEQIKIYLIILFLVSFFVVWFLRTKLLIILSVVLLLLPVYEFKILSYFYYKNTTTNFFEKNYVKPIITKEKKNNLIIVYLESFEEHFAEEDISPFLAKLKKENISFRGFSQLPSTFLTIFAQYASMCGVMIRQNMNEYTNFAPNIECIPDLLKANGYNTMYLKAADVNFSRANYFAEQHSFDVIKGYLQMEKQASKISSDYLGNEFIGFKDRVLFELAKDEIGKLKEPFFVTITTLDMHLLPGFFFDPDCERKFGDLRDVAACTSNSLEDFVEWLKKQTYWENTTLVILGDHKINSINLSKTNPLNVFVNSKISTDNLNRKFTTYDFAPTIMEAMGYDIDEFGIGRSLFSSEETMLEQEGEKFSYFLSAKSKFYDELKQYKGIKSFYNLYKLNDLLDDKILLNRYADFGSKNDMCNIISQLSFNLNKLPEKGVYLKMKYLKPNVSFSIFANDNLIYENKYVKNQIIKEDELIVFLPKFVFKKDKKLILEFLSENSDMNKVFGLCIKEFFISATK